MEFYFDEVESCELCGSYIDEYVYDVEVDDDTHTFMANGILVHNSVYVTLGDVLDSANVTDDKINFIINLNKEKVSPFLGDMFERYAKMYGVTNTQNLEMEKISYGALMVAKKKYILDFAWKDSGVIYSPQEKIKPTGIEIVQGSTPKYVRGILTDMVKLILSRGNNITYDEIVSKLLQVKQEFNLKSPDDISYTKSVGDYEKFILEDKKQLVLGSKCPIHVRAAGIYNHKLFNSKYRNKYNTIKTGDKIKYYYTKSPKKYSEDNVFGFVPNSYPMEFAIPLDYDTMFEKIVLDPLNRWIGCMGFPPVPSNLVYTHSLF